MERPTIILLCVVKFIVILEEVLLFKLNQSNKKGKLYSFTITYYNCTDVTCIG